MNKKWRNKMTKKKVFWWAVAIATVVVLVNNKKVKETAKKVTDFLVDKII
jgi:ABC-type phosphate/phosphonate transport system substrate-binding protein